MNSSQTDFGSWWLRVLEYVARLQTKITQMGYKPGDRIMYGRYSFAIHRSSGDIILGDFVRRTITRVHFLSDASGEKHVAQLVTETPQDLYLLRPTELDIRPGADEPMPRIWSRYVLSQVGARICGDLVLLRVEFDPATPRFVVFKREDVSKRVMRLTLQVNHPQLPDNFPQELRGGENLCGLRVNLDREWMDGSVSLACGAEMLLTFPITDLKTVAAFL